MTFPILLVGFKLEEVYRLFLPFYFVMENYKRDY